MLKNTLIFLLVEEEIVLARIIGPYVLDALVDFALVLDFVQVFDDFERSARAVAWSISSSLVAGHGASSSLEANSSVQYISVSF